MQSSCFALRAVHKTHCIPCRGIRGVRGSTVPESETRQQQLEKPIPTFPLKPRDEPAYAKYTAEQRDWFWRWMVRQQGIIWPIEMPTEKYPLPPALQKHPEKQVDPEAEPFRQIYEGNDGDDGTFSGAEVVQDKNVWFWVQRLLPSPEPPTLPRSDSRERLPSGWIPPPITPPDRTFFVRRLPNGLFPVFKHLIHREVVRVKLITDHVFDPEPDVLTLVELVDGEIRDLEIELVNELQRQKKRKILSAVSEFEGKITLKGNHVEEVVKWLEDNGF